jgi:hypothetical protein
MPTIPVPTMESLSTPGGSENCLGQGNQDMQSQISEPPSQPVSSPSSALRGRYSSATPDRHTPISMGQVLLRPRSRPGRIYSRKQGDPQSDVTYGDPIIFKAPGTSRFLFQNVKGLTHTTGSEDYNYFLSWMSSFAVDVFGMAETNTSWQHQHLQADFKARVHRQFRYGKTVFGFPSSTVEPSHHQETYQAGGSLQVVKGRLTTTALGNSISDPSGLGRWCGITLVGRRAQKFSIITAYRTCDGSISASPLGSTFHREYMFFKDQGETKPQPRRRFLQDLQTQIKLLQEDNHAVLLMLDANATLESDHHFLDTVNSLDLIDLHSANPAPSTYIGSSNRRIDYMFGCPKIKTVLSRHGSLAYFEGPHSDHRGLYVDLDLQQLFDLDLESVQLGRSELRSLRTGNPELVEKYIQEMKQYYNRHKMQERIDTLYDTHTKLSREAVRKLLISWDNDQGRAMISSERTLRIQPKPHQWSPALRNAAFIMRYWKLRLRELKYAEDYTVTFHRWELQLKTNDTHFSFPFKDDVAMPIAIIRIHLQAATKYFRKVQSESKDFREKSFHELLAQYDADESPSTKQESRRKAKIVNRTITSEACRRLFGAIRQIVNPSEVSPLSKLQVPRKVGTPDHTLPSQVTQLLQDTPSDNLVWDTIITQQEIETHLLTFNREAFRAAAESPCGHGVIHDAITFTSLSPASTDLLNGIIPTEWYGDNDLLREFLASFQIPESVLAADPIPTTVTGDDILYGFKGWKESTSTSPSGRHLGHYKALIQDPMLLACFVKFFNIAISRGIAVPRWSQAVNVMIEKDPGQPRINRLRIIHLFEADYNLFLKMMWGSRLVRRALQMNLLNDGQHGSVPGRTTMDPIMLNQLTTDMCRVLRTNYVRFDNDASACFDRIIVALGMLAARRCGMPDHAVQTHAQSLQLMKYTVKTVYGISEDSYQGTPFAPLFGTGQGSGASPAVWLTLVVLLLNTLEKVVPERIWFRSHDGSLEHRRLVDAFVDDTALGFTDDGSSSLPDLITALERAAQTWEQLLHFSGGALNLSKCSWYVLYWDWRKGRPQLRPISSTDPNVQLRKGSSSNTTNIRRQSVDSASRLLGVYQTPSGDFSEHLTVLKAKADKLAGYLRSPRLSASDVRVFHRTMYTPAMRYSLHAIAVDEEAFEAIQSKIIPTIVQKLGITSKIPTAVRHGPPEMGGLGLTDLRTEGGIEMIRFFRHAVYKDSSVGQLLRLSLQASQLESGLPNPLLENPFLHVKYLTPTWILSMRQYMFNHNIKIRINDTPAIPLKSKSDTYIMCLKRLNLYSSKAQIDINLVRIYLQVTTISELSDPMDRKCITSDALHGIRPATFSSNPGWPRQAAPSKDQTRLWKTYISSQFLRYDLFWQNLPTDDESSTSDSADESASSTPPIQLTMKAAIRQLPPYQRRLLSHVQQNVSDVDAIAACTEDETFTFATDGGLKGQRGTFGWLISSSTNVILYEGAGPVDGPFDSSSSTRSELGGYAAVLLFHSLLCSIWNMAPTRSYRWICDSKAALSNSARVIDSNRIIKGQPNNADYLGIIKEHTKEFAQPIEPVWVKGHQTRPTANSTASSDQDIRHNNYVDNLATWYREHSQKPQSKEKSDHVPSSIVSVYINNVRLVNNIEESIRFHIDGYHLRQYTQRKHDWIDATWDSIDFASFGSFYNSLLPADQSQHTKFLFDQQSVGVNRYQRATIKAEELHHCPCCRQPKETTDHVLQCTANPGFLECLSDLRKVSHSSDNHPTLKLLCLGFCHWIQNPDTPYAPDISGFPNKFKDSIAKALAEQNTIGWSQAVRGYLSYEWRQMASEGIYDTDEFHDGRGQQTLRLALTALFKYTTTMWRSRNRALHDDQSPDLRAIRDQEVAVITELYTKHDKIGVTDRHYCDHPLESILRKNPSSRRRWVRYMHRARTRYNLETQHQPLITSFFRKRG